MKDKRRELNYIKKLMSHSKKKEKNVYPGRKLFSFAYSRHLQKELRKSNTLQFSKY